MQQCLHNMQTYVMKQRQIIRKQIEIKIESDYFRRKRAKRMYKSKKTDTMTF